MADKVVRRMRTRIRRAPELKDVIELLRAEVERAGNQTMFAKKAVWIGRGLTRFFMAD